MSLFKCKMCGGDLEIAEGLTVAECEYCGTKQTLPKLDDERRANMYDRANHFRRNNEFDKAMGIYENILNEDGTDAEAYWSIVLCRYGIEYVEDPATKRRIPTVNRAQFTSIFDDEDYKSAVANADTHQRAIYEAEAEAINKIQKGILAISQKEEPFDVFICYKETDNNGRRTPDSVLAQELYYGLKNEGFKVFFSRITLEDKLGSAYEPYIFAALNSAKVMVVLGTRPEYFSAVWVKNEWSRYLSLIKGGAKKVIIPAYKDMDPYDLPEEFSHLQAQDMSKLGFMQDIIRGIKKIVVANEVKPTVVKETVVREAPVMAQNIGISPLLDRAFMFLEDGEFDRADEFLENVLNQDPRNAEAYVGKLLVDLKVKTKEMLTVYPTPFDENGNYKKAIRFGDDKLRAELEGVIVYINTRNENARLEDVYCRAKTAMQLARTEISCKDAANIFETIRSYKDSEELIAECLEKAEEIRKDSYLNKARVAMAHNNIVQYEEAIKILGFIPGWKDADELVDTYKQRIAKIKEKAEADRIERERLRLERERQAEIKRQTRIKIAKRAKKIAIITTPIVCTLIAFIIVLNTVIIPLVKYNNAVDLMEAGKFEKAYSIFKELGDYKDSADKASEIKVASNIQKLKKAKVGDYVFFGTYEQDNNVANGKEDIEWLVLDVQDGKALVISKYSLECKSYDAIDKYVTWEFCSLRQWLNNSFVYGAFTDEEKAMIPTVTVPAHENPKHNTNPGNAAQDKVFLLSNTEVNLYFDSDDERKCEPTAYAIAQMKKNNIAVASIAGWWLRTPGVYNDRATIVYDDGLVSKDGYPIHGSTIAVRPAMWIDLIK